MEDANLASFFEYLVTRVPDIRSLLPNFTAFFASEHCSDPPLIPIWDKSRTPSGKISWKGFLLAIIEDQKLLGSFCKAVSTSDMHPGLIYSSLPLWKEALTSSPTAPLTPGAALGATQTPPLAASVGPLPSPSTVSVAPMDVEPASPLLPPSPNASPSGPGVHTAPYSAASPSLPSVVPAPSTSTSTSAPVAPTAAPAPSASAPAVPTAAPAAPLPIAHTGTGTGTVPVTTLAAQASAPSAIVPAASGTPAGPASGPLSSEMVLAVRSRESVPRDLELQGVLKFVVATNDGTPQHLIWLVALKDIFRRQLPRMPPEYITRLVFDRNHRSVIAIKDDKQVIGGITFKAYIQLQLGEIAFCAIDANEQVRGYGTRLMNHVKQYALSIGIRYFLTYADNFAIVYFQKQGFTEHITTPAERWAGYVKDYEGSTMMECILHPRIDYTKIPEMIHRQREAIFDRVRDLSASHRIYPGIGAPGPKELPPQPASIPGVVEAKFGSLPSRRTPQYIKMLGRRLLEFHKELEKLEDSEIFLEPVNPLEVTDYLDYIKNPIDLGTMKQRLRAGNYYIRPEIYLADLQRMIENCKTYNRSDTSFYKNGIELELYLSRKWPKFLQSLPIPEDFLPGGRSGSRDRATVPPAGPDEALPRDLVEPRRSPVPLSPSPPPAPSAQPAQPPRAVASASAKATQHAATAALESAALVGTVSTRELGATRMPSSEIVDIASSPSPSLTPSPSPSPSPPASPASPASPAPAVTPSLIDSLSPAAMTLGILPAKRALGAPSGSRP